MKRRLLLVLILIVSCKEMDLKKVDESTLVQEELENINWSSVDQYPSFTDCQDESEASKELCFKTTLVNHINSSLASANLVVTEDVSDTLMLRIQISNKGLVSVTEVKAKATTREIIPEIDSLVHQSMRTLPKVLPAIKRSQEVTTEFQLPLVISIK